MNNIIEINDLTKSYGKSRGIEHVNLAVKEGEIFGFIGPNGAGKSTTIRTILGLLHPTSGSATIFGKDCIAYRDVNAKEIGYLPSEVFYYDHMKVKDLLAYSASFYEKDCTQRMQELCALLELDVNRKIEDLSYGNRKKVGIVQGLLHKPKLLILDEPTSGLDPLMQNKFFDLIRKENSEGATILFSSHILGEVQKLCNRVAIIKNGKILKIEEMDSLHKSTYKQVELSCSQDISKLLMSLPNVAQLNVDKDNYSFMYSGSMNILIKILGSIELDNLDIHEPDLEDVFMHYYQEEKQ
ncbi:MAG: ABC transporter ATP-binding protein [Longicatena sp.]